MRQKKIQRCSVLFCNHERTWIWQPAGPSTDSLCFVLPGSHYRGFAAIPLCDDHKQAIERGIAKVITYHGQNYVYVANKLEPVLNA
jgi:hypothetical protein